jgi:hypothetical protein
LDIIEKQFRDTPASHKKYLLRLTNYIEHLLKNKRIVEAKFYFEKIPENKKQKLNIIHLGYELAIRTFDKASILYFDKLLYQHKKNDIDLSYYRLKFYLSNNDIRNCEFEAKRLLSHTLDIDSLNLIIETFFITKDYKIAIHISNYIKNKKIQLHVKVINEMKRALLVHLMNTIIRRNNA